MSKPVNVVTRDDNNGNHEHDFVLFKAPCLGKECAYTYTQTSVRDNITKYYCTQTQMIVDTVLPEQMQEAVNLLKD